MRALLLNKQMNRVLVAVTLSMGLQACGGNDDQEPPLAYINQIELGGETSVSVSGSNGFSEPAANLDFTGQGEFNIGNVLFEKNWTRVGSANHVFTGLGGLFNVDACQSCHINDGRGHAPEENDANANSLLVRLYRPAKDENEEAELATGLVANLADGKYGGQLQDKAQSGIPVEADVVVTYENKIMRFQDGFEVTLRKPTFSFENLGYGEMGSDTRLSPRVANAMIGLGLLENISESDILALADPEDVDGDGISGEANFVMDVIKQELVLGRFGWKAGQPSLRQQSAGAFNGDMGLTTTLFPNENCTDIQQECLNEVSAIFPDDVDQAEVQNDELDSVEFYVQHLAVPVRRNVDNADVMEGAQLFSDLGCVDCHNPSFNTQVNTILTQLSEQVIFPFTDMLLHDMGEELADQTLSGAAVGTDEVAEYLANGREWRTAPLWGIGLTQTVDSQATFLHDGRARTLMEAVLWHGGEAEASLQKVLTLNESERNQLIAFLESL